MKKFGMILAGVLTVTGLMAPMMAKPAMAVTSKICSDESFDAEQKAAAGCGSQRSAGAVASDIIKVVLGFVGVVAVIVMIYGGFLFLSSSGDAGKVKKGQDAIKYGLIGLVVAISAYIIVAFVSGSISG